MSKIKQAFYPMRYLSPLSAPTYYVDATGGSDSNNGRSPSTAWQTIAKVNSSTFQPGNSILFKRGGTFAGSIVPPSAGAAGRNIIFADYGSGALPIIDGNATSGGFYCTGATKHHYTVRNLDFYRGGYGAAANSGAHDIEFIGCTARSATNTGFSAWHQLSDSAYPENISFTSCTANNNAIQGFFVGADVNVDTGPVNCLIDTCIAHTNGTNVEAHHGIYARYQVTIRNCTCYSNSSAGIKLNDENNTSATLYPTCYNNVCYSNRYGITVTHTNCIVHDNVCYSNFQNIMILSASQTLSCFIYFNTVVNTVTTSNACGVRWNTGTHATQVTFKNNLIVNDLAVVTAGRLPMNMDNSASVASGNTINYNVYYFDGNIATVIIGSRTFPIWQGLTGTPDVNGTLLTALPAFVTRYTDFHPTAAGNLIGLGVALSGYTLDKDSVTRSDPPEAGAYEYP